jgi:hypothetical protein
MSVFLQRPAAWSSINRGSGDPTDSGDAMIGFSISPTGSGAWSWRTFDLRGRLRAQGLAASRKLAAALVIHHIISARAEQAAPRSAETPARAA